MNRSVAAVVLVCGVAAFSGARAATVFSFQFDNQGITASNGNTDGAIVPPVVGTGTFISATDLSPGTYALASGTGLPTLSGYTFNFDIQGDSYDQTDITTPLQGVAVQITASGSGERLFFTETGQPGSDGGPHGGALDLDIEGGFLTFEPTSFGGNYLYQELPQEISLLSDPIGRYCAVSEGGSCPSPTNAPVPEPASFAVLAGGLAVLVGRKRLA